MGREEENGTQVRVTYWMRMQGRRGCQQRDADEEEGRAGGRWWAGREREYDSVYMRQI